MADFEFRIKAPGALACSGPLTFAELRELIHAGLVDGETRLADDDFVYHPLKSYPDLWDALHDPSVAGVERQSETRLASRAEVTRERDRNTAAPILDPTESDLIDFDAVRRDERGFSSLDVLALNRMNEAPEKPIRWPAWHRRSRLVDLRRWLLAGSPLIAVITLSGIRAAKIMRAGEADYGLIPVVCVFSFSFLFLMILWGYFFLIDYHYPGKA